MLTVPIASFHLENALCFAECGFVSAAINSTSSAIAALQRKVPCTLVVPPGDQLSSEQLATEVLQWLRNSVRSVGLGDFPASAREAMVALQALQRMSAEATTGA